MKKIDLGQTIGILKPENGVDLVQVRR